MEKREAIKEVKLRFTEKQHKALKAIADERGNTITAVVRDFIAEGIKRESQGPAVPLKPEEPESTSSHRPGRGTRAS